MSREYYIIEPDGTRIGPCAEEEILELLDSGNLHPKDRCLDAASGRICPAGELFQVIFPDENENENEDEDPTEPEPEPVAAPVPWKPVPFPDPGEAVRIAAPEAKPRTRLLYRGNPCVLTYWRSVLLAAAVMAGGWLEGREIPEFRAVGLVCGSIILFCAILHRLGTQYTVTSARVELAEGLVIRSSRELPLTDITSISVSCTGLPGMLGIGSVRFSAAAGAHEDIIFSRVARAAALKSMVRGEQEGRRR